jgi:hypothetical protein
MDTRSCPTCRSVNHANLARCMNCGSTMELAAVTAGTDGSIGPPPAPGSYGWSAIVAQSPPTPRRRPWAAIAFGVIVILAFVALLALQLTVDPSAQATRAQLNVIRLMILAVGCAYWGWMFFDAHEQTDRLGGHDLLPRCLRRTGVCAARDISSLRSARLKRASSVVVFGTHSRPRGTGPLSSPASRGERGPERR